MNSTRKIMPLDQLIDRVRELQAAGKRVVFTNGCFDILHAGHVDYLTKARAEGDALVVGLNSDDSVRSIKDEGRPIVDQAGRAAVLAGLACVDFITIFEASDPLALIVALRPDVLVKGADWPLERIVGAKEVAAYGGKVRRVSFVNSVSTSEIVRRIVNRYGGGRGDA
jgi:rfaE bifunctional protein nucleotidyltransferase chain/domain